jgi:hypothetical protein
MSDEGSGVLTVTGLLTADLRLVLGPGFIAPTVLHPPEPEREAVEGTPTVELHLLDEHQGVLIRRPLTVMPVCVFRQGETAWLVAGQIPWVRAARIARYVHDEQVLAELTVPARGPRIDVTWRPGARAEGVQAVTWRSSPSEEGPSHHVVLYSWNNGRDWQPVSLPSTEQSTTVDFDEMPGGDECLIRILASSGIATTVWTSGRFAVARKGVRTLIIAPSDGEVVPATAAVFSGQAYDLEKRTFLTEGLAWSTDRAGRIAEGPVVLVSLPPGQQVLTLTDEGSGASMAVTIDADPTKQPLNMADCEEVRPSEPQFPA